MPTIATPPADSPRAQLLNREEAAAYLGVKPSTLADWRLSGKYRNELPCGRIGRRVFYRKADLDRWLAAQIH